MVWEDRKVVEWPRTSWCGSGLGWSGKTVHGGEDKDLRNWYSLPGAVHSGHFVQPITTLLDPMENHKIMISENIVKMMEVIPNSPKT
jgi:hypothetical protein